MLGKYIKRISRISRAVAPLLSSVLPAICYDFMAAYFIENWIANAAPSTNTLERPPKAMQLLARMIDHMTCKVIAEPLTPAIDATIQHGSIFKAGPKAGVIANITPTLFPPMQETHFNDRWV